MYDFISSIYTEYYRFLEGLYGMDTAVAVFIFSSAAFSALSFVAPLCFWIRTQSTFAFFVMVVGFGSIFITIPAVPLTMDHVALQTSWCLVDEEVTEYVVLYHMNCKYRDSLDDPEWSEYRYYSTSVQKPSRLFVPLVAVRP